MKKWICTGFLVLPLLLNGCVAYQDDFQTLKIKVINLETTINGLQAAINQQNKRISEVEQKLQDMQKAFSQDVLINIKTQILSDIEEIKTKQAQLASEIEQIKFSQEEKEKEIKNEFEELNTKIMALDLKLKNVESIISNTPYKHNETVGNQTSISSPVKNSSNQTLEKSLNVPAKQIEISNQTSNQTAYNKTAYNKTSLITSNQTQGNYTNGSQIIYKSVSNNTSSIKKPLTEAELFQQAYTYFKNKNFDKAIEAFKKYLEKFPKGKWIGQAYYWIGESYFNQKKYEEAILNYQKLIDLPGFHPLKPSAMYKQALAFKALGDKEAFNILIKKLLINYPHSKEAQKAKKLINSGT